MKKAGWAALGRVDVNLADLGTLSVSANMHSSGFGTLEQRVVERYRDDFLQFDIAANLEWVNCYQRKLVCRFRYMQVILKQQVHLSMIRMIWTSS